MRAQARLRHADARDAGALVAEQELGVVPALVLLADEVLDRHPHVVEEHLVDLVAAVDGLTIGRTVMPGVFMSISRNEMPSCFFAAGSVRTRQKIQSAYCAERGPGLLAVDDVVVAVALRRAVFSEARSEPAPGSEKPWHHQSSRLRMRGRIALLLRLVAERDDHRADHVDAERQRLGRRLLLHLLAGRCTAAPGPSRCRPIPPASAAPTQPFLFRIRAATVTIARPWRRETSPSVQLLADAAPAGCVAQERRAPSSRNAFSSAA